MTPIIIPMPMGSGGDLSGPVPYWVAFFGGLFVLSMVIGMVIKSVQDWGWPRWEDWPEYLIFGPLVLTAIGVGVAGIVYGLHGWLS